MELKMSSDFEPLDLDSIKKELKRLNVQNNEKIDKIIFEFENSLSDDELIEKLKNILLIEYGYCANKSEYIEGLDKYQQIEELRLLLRESEFQKNRNEQREKLKSLVTEYKHDNLYPPLPEKPDGSLFGIGFIYDFYKDYILWVITILEDKENILAVHEHEGTLTIYSKYPYHIQEIDVEGDDWFIFNFVPENGEWIEVERNYGKSNL